MKERVPDWLQPLDAWLEYLPESIAGSIAILLVIAV